MRVLVTRPEKEGRATAARLAALGHEALLEPVTTIVAAPVADLPPPGDVAALTATSLNAVEVLIGRGDLDPWRSLPFFAVGDRTARAAREAGFTDVRSAEGDRRDLARLLRAEVGPSSGAVVWLVGRDRAGDLVADLAPDGLRVVPIEVYRAEPVAALSEATVTALAAGSVDAALVFSPRSGVILLEKLADRGFRPGSLDFSVHAISEATARPFREAGWREVVVASSPDTDAILATLGAPRPAAEAESRSSSMPSRSDKGRSKTVDTAETPAAEMPAVEAGAAETSVETTGDAATSEPIEAVVEAITPETRPEGVAAPIDEAPAIEPTPVESEAAPAEPAAVAAPSAPASAPISAPARSGGIGLAVAAAVVGGVVGVAGSWGLAAKGLLPTGGDARVAALEATIAALKAEKPAADPATAAKLADLDKRLADLAARPEAAADTSALEGRLAKLEAAPAVTLPADLGERLATLEAAAKARAEAAQASISSALAALPNDGAAKEALEQVAGRVDQAIASTRESTGAAIAALQAKIDTLGAGLEAERKALAERAGSVSTALEAEVKKRNDDVAAALDGLRKRLQGFEGLRGELDAALGRVGALENTTREVGEAGRKVGVLEGRVAGVEAEAEAARKAQGDAVTVLSLADLRSAVDAGRPFAAELAAAETTARGAVDLSALKPYAAKGVPGPAALRASWAKSVRAVIVAGEKRPADEGVFDRLWSHASGIVRVRPAGETAGEDVAAVASRVEARLAAGDLAGAAEAWKTLPEASRKVSAEFGAALGARVGVDKALSDLTAAVTAKLTKQSQ